MMDKHDDLIPRPFYIEKIRPFMGTHLIKVLTGQRRTGKSYLLYQLMDELRKADPEASFLYINPELADYRTLRTGYDLYDYIKAQHPTRRTNLFIDEIQEFSGFEHCLKSLFAENLCDIYCSGSNASLLGGELATYLAGRYIQIEVHPLSYREFLDFYGRTHSRESLELYLHIGGMPYLASLSGLPQSEHLSMEYLKNIYESILLRDVVARENIRNIPFLEQ
jgi:predicted AAA+ superfamily ATPase